MFRIAALVAGALAGFVASLILALGGLEVSAAAFGGLGERQLALARFGLIFIANLSLLGAGVSLAIPRAGAIILILAGAGGETTTRLIGFAGQVLADHPDQRRVLVSEPGLIANAVEELLRYESPSPIEARCLTRDVDLHGRTMPAGSPVLLLKAGQGGSGGDLAVMLLNDVYNKAEWECNEANKARLLEILHAYPKDEPTRKRFVQEMIAWSGKFGELERGDPELHHAAGALYAEG